MGINILSPILTTCCNTLSRNPMYLNNINYIILENNINLQFDILT